MEIVEIIKSLDIIILLIVGSIVGFFVGQIMKGGSLIGNIVLGMAGSLVSGFVFDWLNFMDVGDIADPVIAGVFGAVILLAIAWAVRGKKKPPEGEPQ